MYGDCSAVDVPFQVCTGSCAALNGDACGVSVTTGAGVGLSTNTLGCAVGDIGPLGSYAASVLAGNGSSPGLPSSIACRISFALFEAVPKISSYLACSDGGGVLPA